MSRYKVNAGFEYRDSKTYRCRWIVIWQELDSAIAGKIGGYTGGGTYYDENFYCEFEDGKITRLLIDYTDLVSGSEIEFDDDVPSKAREVISGAYDLFDEYINEDERYDADRLILNEEKIADLLQDGDMLLEAKDDHSLLGEIIGLTPITVKLN